MTSLAAEPGSAPWLRLMTASKVAAVLGLSPWESPFSLWHRMSGTAGAKPATPETERGHYLEPAVARWWCDRHREFDVALSPLLFYAKDNARHAASPDGTLHLLGCLDQSPVAALEVKTAARDDVWGEDGSDEIPVYYRAQALWQAYVLDVPRVHFAVLTSFLEFREYVVERDETDLGVIHEAVAAFLDSLDHGEAPALDGHTETYRVLRQLHPDIDGSDVDLDPELVGDWLASRDDLATATDEEQRLRSLVLQLMGSAKRGLRDGTPVAQRVASKGAPYLKYLPIKGDQ